MRVEYVRGVLLSHKVLSRSEFPMLCRLLVSDKNNEVFLLVSSNEMRVKINMRTFKNSKEDLLRKISQTGFSKPLTWAATKFTTLYKKKIKQNKSNIVECYRIQKHNLSFADLLQNTYLISQAAYQCYLLSGYCYIHQKQQYLYCLKNSV